MDRIVRKVFAEVNRRWKRHGAVSRIHPLMHIPVPWVFVLTFLIGCGLNAVVPLTIPSASLRRISLVAGIVLMACGLALAGWSLSLFRAARTTTIPFEEVSQLVTWGPYRFSRNPMYISLTLIYLGEAGMLALIWPLLLLPLILAYIHWIVIPVEESGLRKVFGIAYEQYCTRVHRWI